MRTWRPCGKYFEDESLFSLSTIKPCGENADALAKGDDGGPDEELRDGGEDGDDDEGEQEVFALVQAGQH